MDKERWREWQRWGTLTLALIATDCSNTGSGGEATDPSEGGSSAGSSGSMDGSGSTSDSSSSGSPSESSTGQGEPPLDHPPIDRGTEEVGGPSNLPAPATTGLPEPSGTPDGLQVINWAGFGSAVSYTFDDSNTSQIASYDALQVLGVPFSFYLITSKSESNNDIWARALTDGHEIANHTHTHLNMDRQADFASDTDRATEFLEDRFSIRVATMAAPFGASGYIEVARTRFLINRGVGGGEIAPNSATNPLNLPTFIPSTGAPAADFNARTDSARTNGTWYTVLIHGFDGYPAEGAYQPVALEEFVAAVEYAKGFGDVWIGTVVDVGSYWIAQKLLSETTPTTAGETTTWTWELPEFFPPDQFLRVIVNGGSLQQGGVTLPWDEHGYYEVALDAGSLTLGPPIDDPSGGSGGTGETGGTGTSS